LHLHNRPELYIYRSLKMPRHADAVELDEMLRRLESINERLPQNDRSGSNGSNKTAVDFHVLRENFVKTFSDIQEMKKSLDEGASDLKSITNKIRQKRNIHKGLEELVGISKAMKQLIDKQRNSKSRRKNAVSSEEVSNWEIVYVSFLQILGKFQQDLQRGKFGDVNTALYTATSRDELLITASAGIGGDPGGISVMAATNAGIGLTGDATATTENMTMTTMQKQILCEIQQTDQAQDKILDEIRQLIEQASESAIAIGKTIEMQNKMLTETEGHVEESHKGFSTLNSRIKKSLKAKGLSWERVCGLFTCLILVLGVVGVLVATI
jgi:hypothetical protein